MTGFCTTWNGEGDALAGTRTAASDIEFSIDIDDSGTELVRMTPAIALLACRATGPTSLVAFVLNNLFLNVCLLQNLVA